MKSQREKANAYFERLRKKNWKASYRSRGLHKLLDRLSTRACNVLYNCWIVTIPELKHAVRNNYFRFCRNFGFASDLNLHRALGLPFPIRLLGRLPVKKTRKKRKRVFHRSFHDPLKGRNPFDVLRALTEDLGPKLYVRAAWKDPFLNLIPRPPYPDGAGYVRNSFVVGRSEPANDEENWKAIVSES